MLAIENMPAFVGYRSAVKVRLKGVRVFLEAA